jgi:predicted nucleic acid-binding protein
VILVDTSALIDSFTGTRRSAGRLRSLGAAGERLMTCSLVLYEWRRGPRLPSELRAQEALFPEASVIAFGAAEASIAAQVYRTVRRPRGREINLAIAACALRWDAALWTLNPDDFRDVPGVRLVEPLP